MDPSNLAYTTGALALHTDLAYYINEPDVSILRHQLQKYCRFYFALKDSGTFSKCPQLYIKLTGFEDNNGGMLPIKYY